MMRISTILGALVLLSGSAFVAGEEPATITISNLPIADEEDWLVCYNDITGKLGTCRGQGNWIDVNCDLGESINTALARATTPAGVQLTILIGGTCNENVWIQRANTLLTGTGATIVGQSAGTAAVAIGGTRVGLTNLTIINGGSGPGVWVAPSASVELEGSVIQSSAGPALGVVAGTAMISDGNTITTTGNQSFPAILALHGAEILIGNNNTISNAANAPYSYKTTIAGDARVLISMLGDGNQVTNTAGERALVLDGGSTFYQQNGHAVLNGGVMITNMSNAHLRDVEIHGDVAVTLFGSLLLQDDNSDGVLTHTVTGTTTVGHLSNLKVLGTNVSLNGDLTCEGLTPGTLTGDPPIVSGSDTCAP